MEACPTIDTTTPPQKVPPPGAAIEAYISHRCGHCVQFWPTLCALSGKYTVRAWESWTPDGAKALQEAGLEISSVPTVYIVSGGTRTLFQGLRSYDALAQAVDAATEPAEGLEAGATKKSTARGRPRKTPASVDPEIGALTLARLTLARVKLARPKSKSPKKSALKLTGGPVTRSKARAAALRVRWREGPDDFRVIEKKK